MAGCRPQEQTFTWGSWNEATPLPPGEPASTVSNKEIIIAVMGVTGSGKSSLIREITGHSEVEVSDGLNSCTTKVVPYTFQHDGTTITLVDTPGFRDSSRSDVEILNEISKWASEIYAEGRLLSGILYLHRISDNRMDGSALRGLRLLKSLVGESNLKNVLLTTTHWSRVTREEGERREKELRETENFWKGLLDLGATLTRYEGHRKSGLELLRKVIPSQPIVLQIQHELIDQGKQLFETSAGNSVNEDLERMQEEYEKKVEKMGDEFQEALVAQNDELKVMLERELNDTVAMIERLETAMRKLPKIESPAEALLYKDELGLLPEKEALLIYVKGTTEMGNVGRSGSLLSSMLDLHVHAQLRSKLAIQGVFYHPVKSVFSVFSGGSRRATRGVLHAVREGIKCSPSTRIFLCGYSQGAMIIRRALSELGDTECARINGVVFFGDPASWGSTLPKTLQDRLLSIRLPFDGVHLPIPVPTGMHHWYSVTFPIAIEFIQRKLEGWQGRPHEPTDSG